MHIIFTVGFLLHKYLSTNTIQVAHLSACLTPRLPFRGFDVQNNSKMIKWHLLNCCYQVEILHRINKFNKQAIVLYQYMYLWFCATSTMLFLRFSSNLSFTLKTNELGNEAIRLATSGGFTIIYHAVRQYVWLLTQDVLGTSWLQWLLLFCC